MTVRRMMLALACSALLAPCARAQERAAYQGPRFEDPALRSLEREPSWTDRLDAPTAVVAGELVFYLREGRLVAARLASGDPAWTYGRGLTAPAAHADGRLFVPDGGDVVALDAVSGRVLWRRPLGRGHVDHVEIHDGRVIAAGGYGAGGTVLDAASGAVLFPIDVPGHGRPGHVTDDLLFWAALYGEPHFSHLHVFDLSTGTELWHASRSSGPLLVADDRAYLLTMGGPSAPPHDPPVLRIAVVEARSGRELDVWRYTTDPERFGRLTVNRSQVTLTPDAVLVPSADGRRVLAFPRGGASAPTAVLATHDSAVLRAGPYRDLLLFEGRQHALRGVHVPTGGGVEYLPRGAPISRLDLLGGRAYVGRTDGLFEAVDLATARMRFFVRAGGFGFGPTLRAAGVLVLQTSDAILVVEDRQ